MFSHSPMALAKARFNGTMGRSWRKTIAVGVRTSAPPLMAIEPLLAFGAVACVAAESRGGAAPPSQRTNVHFSRLV
ncbi:hypothetical protein GCM10022254_69960 [Actinomadura meridiana]|uniref:Uncharacterized protein n=1 Tax=Actinomadura meridiana TaxID=559626 RepID=A0ABP8CN19_9ACTN